MYCKEVLMCCDVIVDYGRKVLCSDTFGIEKIFVKISIKELTKTCQTRC